MSNRLQVNVGLRYEIDTEVNNQSRVGELNPIVQPFVHDGGSAISTTWRRRVGFA